METHEINPLLAPVWEIWDYYGNFSKMPKGIRDKVTLSHLRVNLTVFHKRLAELKTTFLGLNGIGHVRQSTHNERRTLIVELSPVWNALHHHPLQWLEVVEPKPGKTEPPFGLIYVWRTPRPSPCKPVYFDTMRREVTPIRRIVQAKSLQEIFEL